MSSLKLILLLTLIFNGIHNYAFAQIKYLATIALLDGDQLEGHLHSLKDSTVVLKSTPGTYTLTSTDRLGNITVIQQSIQSDSLMHIPVSSISVIKLKKKNGERFLRGTGAIIGIAAGATLGYFLGYYDDSCDDESDPDCEPILPPVVRGMGGAILGGVLGGALGSRLSNRTRKYSIKGVHAKYVAWKNEFEARQARKSNPLP